jgi:hypothetical protein
MNNFDLKQNFKAVVYGGTMAILMLIFGYSLYIKYNTPDLASGSEFLRGGNFDILVEFQKKNVSFRRVTDTVEAILKPLSDTVPPIVPISPSGRSNPFTP